VTVDGGTKCFSTDSGVPLVARGVDAATRYAFFGDEHGKLLLAQGRAARGRCWARAWSSSRRTATRP
jgi:3-hydroxy-D-aspartate aldolase